LNISWPQGIWIALAIIRLVIEAAVDGEPHTGKHKFAAALLGVILSLGLLYWGGFFS
jgi:hypothetical protein